MENKKLDDLVSDFLDIEKTIKVITNYSNSLKEEDEVAYRAFIDSYEYKSLIASTLDIKNSTEKDLKKKVNGYVWVIKKQLKEVELLKERETYFANKRKVLEKQVENMQEHLASQVIDRIKDKEKLFTGDYELSFRTSETIEVNDDSQLTEEFFKVKREVSKEAIKKYLKERNLTEIDNARGDIVAYIKQNRNLQIK